MKIPNLDMNKKDNNDSYILKWPFRMSISGDSSRGKTNLVMYMILSAKFFKPDVIYYYGRNIEQDKIKYIKSISDKLKSQIQYDFMLLENDPNNIPYADCYDNDSKKLVIFDDLMTVSKNVLKRIVDHYIFGRQQNISSIFLGQSYVQIDQTIRLNCNYMIIFEPQTKRARKLVLTENNIDNIDLFKKIDGKYDFLFIDKNNNKYYKNFDEEI